MKSKKANMSANALLKQKVEQGRLPQSVANRLVQKDLIAEDRTLYVRTKLGGAGNPSVSGVIQLITDALDSLVGVTNITKGRLPEDNPFVIEGIRLGYAVAATADAKSATEVLYKYNQDTDLPPALRHADFIVEESGGKVLTAQVGDLLSAEKERISNSEAGLELRYPKLLAPNKRLAFNLEVPNGLSIESATNDVFIEFAVIGTIYRDRANQ